MTILNKKLTQNSLPHAEYARVKMMQDFFFSIIVVILSLLPLHTVFAQAAVTASGTGTSIIVSDKNVKDGNIISYTKGKYILATSQYDVNIVGVISDNPSVSLIDSSVPGSRLLVSSGKVFVLVSTKNGPIKAGDFITSSSVKGVGQKATEDGYVIGAATEDYTDTTKPGRILVDIHAEFRNLTTNERQNLLETLRLGAKAAKLSPVDALRYFGAILIAISSFVLGFVFFGRISTRGVEAVGRNPLASKKILTSVVLNVTITVVIIGAGVAIAYLILVV